ncbi:MAG: hypothetical protein H7838_09025, partial [Magnetococcus sp. DMHC-8]
LPLPLLLIFKKSRSRFLLRRSQHAPQASRRLSRASRHAPQASRHAPQASRHAPRASRHAPQASRPAPRSSRIYPLFCGLETAGLGGAPEVLGRGLDLLVAGDGLPVVGLPPAGLPPDGAGLLFVAILTFTPFGREIKNLLTFDSSGSGGLLQAVFTKKSHAARAAPARMAGMVKKSLNGVTLRLDRGESPRIKDRRGNWKHAIAACRSHAQYLGEGEEGH